MKKVLLILPAYNEEEIIQQSMLRLDLYLSKKCQDFEVKVMVVDNNSNDKTRERIYEILPELPQFEYFKVEEQGKGAAIAQGWQKYEDMYDYFGFMDADIATDLEALPKALDALEEYDLAIGDRYHKESKTKRSLKRSIVSRSYRYVARTLLSSKISDFPCGFKIVKREIVRDIVPLVQNRLWFFDSELVYLCEKQKKSICSIPIQWKDPRSKVDKSKVSIVTVTRQYLKELIRLMK